MGRSELRSMGVVLMSHDWMKCPLETAENDLTQRIPLKGCALGVIFSKSSSRRTETKSIDIY